MTSNVISGRLARNYENYIKKHRLAAIIDKLIIENTKQGINKRICEICCGPGNNIKLFVGRFKEIVGVDLSEDMLNICREKFKKNLSVRLVNKSATDTGLKSSYFDYVLIRMGIHHIKEKEEVIAEASRLLKKTGKFLVIDKFYYSRCEMYIKAILKLILQFNPHSFGEYILSKEG